MTDLGDLGSRVQRDAGGDNRGRRSKEQEIRALFSQPKMPGKGVWESKLSLLLFFLYDQRIVPRLEERGNIACLYNYINNL